MHNLQYLYYHNCKYYTSNKDIYCLKCIIDYQQEQLVLDTQCKEHTCIKSKIIRDELHDNINKLVDSPYNKESKLKLIQVLAGIALKTYTDNRACA